MKRFLACLALCASLSASAQGDNCTVLGIQDLTQMVFELKAEIDSLKSAGMTRDSVVDIAVGVAWRGELAGADLLMPTSLMPTSLVPTSLVPTSLVPTSGVPTSLVPTSSGANLDMVPTSLVPTS